MVPADSRGIPRAPRYSGYRYASAGFAYGAVTLCGGPFQVLPLARFLAMSRSYNPGDAVTSPVWAPPRSLATTGGIIVYFLFLRVLRCFSSPRSPPVLDGMISLQDTGLSHSEIAGSRVICTSPALIAACHVLHRQREPRHPPHALSYFFRTPDFSARCGQTNIFVACARLFFTFILLSQNVIDLICHRHSGE